MDNRQLAEVYNKVYKNDSSFFYTFNTFPESKLIIEMIPRWNGLQVLEIGCGEGRLAAMLSFAGAEHVDALDYSQEAISIARKRIKLDNVYYQCVDYREVEGQYDAVVLQGVLEHLDDPFVELDYIFKKFVRNGGVLITSSPSFINPRGYVWMTLQLLFDVPMSLTDLHFLCPFDFEQFAKKNGYDIEFHSTDQDWGSGERLLIDFQKRLPNALRDVGMDGSKVSRLLAWIEKAVRYQPRTEVSGATFAYKFCKQ
ncbi:MAG: class I SAM-dependent methyltransferase [Candidatus Electronema sp. VV]